MQIIKHSWQPAEHMQCEPVSMAPGVGWVVLLHLINPQEHAARKLSACASLQRVFYLGRDARHRVGVVQDGGHRHRRPGGLLQAVCELRLGFRV